MQIDTGNTVQVTSNLTVPATAMTLDPEGMAHLIQVLTNLYADKHLAVLREYSTNALDSHVAAGNPDPIEITLPTELNPTLVITDHGTGLSRDDILNVYSRYGASTKRDTNTQVGSFGLGAKSAFTIGGQFIVTATKNGRRTSAVFAMNNHGIPTVSILAEHDTPDPSGVTVSIAVSDPQKMQDAAVKFFRAWRPGTVLVDGREPESFFTAPNAVWLAEDILFTKQDGITVVMGSVAYPLPQSAAVTVRRRVDANWPSYGTGVVVFVPIGAVDITPSREGIRDTERSITAIAAVMKNLQASLAAKLGEICVTAPDVISMIFTARPYLQAAEHLACRSAAARIMPPSIKVADHAAVTLYGKTRRGGLRTEPLDFIRPDQVQLITVLVGVPERRSAKARAKQWISENSRRMLITVGDGNATAGSLDWFRWGTDSPVQTVHYDDIELPSSAATTGSRERTVTAYTVRPPATDGGLLRPALAMTPAELKADGRPVAYTQSESHRHSAALAGHLVVELTARQSVETFLRRVPGAVTTDSLIKAHHDRLLAQAGDLSQLAHAAVMSGAVRQVRRALRDHTDQLTHPTWLATVRAAAAYDALPEEVQALVRTSGADDQETALRELETALPLLLHVVRSYNRYTPREVLDHLVMYVNAAPALPVPYASAA